MRRNLWLIMTILCFVLLSGSVLAQDELVTNTPSAEVTVEPVVTPAPVVDVPPAGGPFEPITSNLIEIVLLVAVVILALQTKNLIPVETVDKVLGKAFQYAKEVTSKTDTPLDDNVVGIVEEVVRRIIRDELAKSGEAKIETALEGTPPMDSDYWRRKFPPWIDSSTGII